MKKDNKFLTLITLMLTFMKIGALTFGGGYAMIPIIQKETVEKRKWTTDNEILDIIAISESTPGPIAVNASTYIGFKVAGFWGSFFATLGLIIPSFIIILIVSFFYEKFMTWNIIKSAFKGLSVGVIILLINAVVKLKKTIRVNAVSIILFTVCLIGMLIINLLKVSIKSPSLIFILFGAVFGIVVSLLTRKEKTK